MIREYYSSNLVSVQELFKDLHNVLHQPMYQLKMPFDKLLLQGKTAELQ